MRMGNHPGVLRLLAVESVSEAHGFFFELGSFSVLHVHGVLSVRPSVQLVI